VALQSTGVYWIPLYEILKNVASKLFGQCTAHEEPARRNSDVQESQWLLKLHTYGLLNNSFNRHRRFACFVPTGGSGGNTCVSGDVRSTYAEGVDADERAISECNQRRQRLTGQTIVRSIVAGEHDPRKLAELSDRGFMPVARDGSRSDAHRRHRRDGSPDFDQ